jgi:peptidoglycan L-alanyl-D-glutamate endopeptidase CwlK
MGNSIDELASYMQPLCTQFLAAAQAAGIECFLVDTGRTQGEQQTKLSQGVSWTQNSRHLPQPPEMKSEAFDVVPKAYMSMKNWNPYGDYWDKLGEIGKGLGLKWGGDWIGHRDPGHFQWQGPSNHDAVADVAAGA